MNKIFIICIMLMSITFCIATKSCDDMYDECKKKDPFRCGDLYEKCYKTCIINWKDNRVMFNECRSGCGWIEYDCIKRMES